MNLPLDDAVLRSEACRRRVPAYVSSVTALPNGRRVFEGGIAAMNGAELARPPPAAGPVRSAPPPSGSQALHVR
jgi:hypothetical protein